VARTDVDDVKVPTCITGELDGGACANGIDCDSVYDTDTEDAR